MRVIKLLSRGVRRVASIRHRRAARRADAASRRPGHLETVLNPMTLLATGRR